MPPVKRLVSLSIAIGLAGFTVVGSRAISHQAVLAQNAILPQQRQLIAQRQSRIALVIGNAAYDEGALANPVNDATDIAKALEELGFDVTLRQDLNKREMEEEIESFSRKLRKGSVGVFYYAGHGVQMDGENYLVPLKARLQNEKDVRYDAVPLGKALNAMESAGNQVNIAIIDACRDNPFYRRWNRTIQGRGLTTVSPPSGIIIAYATRAGNVAADGTGQRNSPFTSALLENIKKPNLDVQLMFRRVSTLVRQKTEAKQEPWTEGNLFGDSFYLNPTLESTSPIAINSPTPKPNSIPLVSTNPNTNSTSSRPITPPIEVTTSTTPQISSIQSQPISDSTSLLTLKGHSQQVKSISISRDGQRIVSGSSDKTIKIWNLANGQLERTIENDYPIAKVIITPDGQNIISANVGSHVAIKVWNLTTGKLERILEGNSDEDIAITPDGQRIVSYHESGIKVWNLATGQLERNLGNSYAWRRSFTISLDGQRIISIGEKIEVRNLVTGELEKPLDVENVSLIAISSDWQRIVGLPKYDKGFKVWNLATGMLERTLGNNYNQLSSSLTISPDGLHLLFIGVKGIAEVWNLATGQLERNLKGLSSSWYNQYSNPIFSPNGQKIVVGDSETIKIWNLETGQLERTLKGHSQMIGSIAISPNGKYIVSGSTDHDIRVWQLE
jgi:WD40 repeat protein